MQLIMPSTTAALRIAFVAIPGFQFVSVAALAAFEFASKIAGEDLYEVSVLSETGGAVRSSLGMTIDTAPFDRRSYDTVIVGGGNAIVPTSPALIAFLRKSAKSSRRLAAICMGAFALADAGILDGRRATTHWAYARAMQAQYPSIQMDEDKIFIIDGQIWTSAGATAGIDLALGMVEKDFGADAARGVARMLVVSHRRAGGQSQHSALLEMDAKSDRMQNALTYARQNLKAPLSVEELARAANLSPRQFSRAFRAETGLPPAKAVENLRVEAARLMMEQSRHPIDFIAMETGFADRERMRRAFLRAFGQPPQVIRRNARNGAMA
jgi:transcriptional regulator GlxA family with amidase domain